MVAIGVVAVAGLGGASGAAAKPRPVLKVAPAKPSVKTPITVSLKAPKIKSRRAYYGAVLTIETGNEVRCAYTVKVALRRTSGRSFTATLKPRTAEPSYSRWCDGPAILEVRRYGPGELYSPVLARREFPVGTGKRSGPTAETMGVPVKITVLGGSTLTASSAGRPDRSSQLSGVLRGRIPGRFKPTTDVQVEGISGSLTPLTAALAQAVFPADPLCPDSVPPGTFDAVPSSQLELKASGEAIFNLVVNGAASQLFGCGPAGALNGTTTLPLTGKLGPKGLPELGLTGSVTGIPLPAGSQGGLAANLVLNVDLSGRP